MSIGSFELSIDDLDLCVICVTILKDSILEHILHTSKIYNLSDILLVYSNHSPAVSRMDRNIPMVVDSVDYHLP